jgi:hypothetical protein
LVIGLVLLQLVFWQAAVALASHPPQIASGPENFQCRAVFIQTRELWFLRVAQVQPVTDSRHGRIACKFLSQPSSKEQRAAASNQFFWLQAAALKIQ